MHQGLALYQASPAKAGDGRQKEWRNEMNIAEIMARQIMGADFRERQVKMKPSRFRAMPVDEFDYEVSIASCDPEAKNGFIYGRGVGDAPTDKGVLFMRSDYDGIMVHAGTVCEFTGFVTRQGVPVYTNDIVRMKGKIAVIKKCNGSRTMGNGMGGFYEFRPCVLYGKDWQSLTEMSMPEMVVIGDIYNNPELLYDYGKDDGLTDGSYLDDFVKASKKLFCKKGVL